VLKRAGKRATQLSSGVMWMQRKGKQTMSYVPKVVATTLLISFVAIMSFLAGELIGMKSGYAHTLKNTTPMDAAYTVSVITLIENNMNQEAIEMLETKLDNYIISHWAANQCRLTALNPFVKERPQNELFYTTVNRRKSHPSKNEIVQEHIQHIEKKI